MVGQVTIFGIGLKQMVGNPFPNHGPIYLMAIIVGTSPFG